MKTLTIEMDKLHAQALVLAKRSTRRQILDVATDDTDPRILLLDFKLHESLVSDVVGHVFDQEEHHRASSFEIQTSRQFSSRESQSKDNGFIIR
jgi:hypothetical protein